MTSLAYQTTRRLFSQRTRNRIKAGLARLRSRCSKVYVMRHGSFGVTELRDHLLKTLPTDFDVLMVHSGYDHFLPMFTGSPWEIVGMLEEFCGNSRTLAMPAFFFGGPSSKARDHYLRRPVFDEMLTPSEMGIITEIFRRRNGVVRSLHPTHSVCAKGPLAEQLTASHHLANTTFGSGTPFGLMSEVKTVVLGMGCYYYRNLTHVHVAEDLMGAEFPLPRHEVATVGVRLISRKRGEFPYQAKFRVTELPRNLGILRSLLTSQQLSDWRFHGVPMFFADATAVTRSLKAAATKGLTIYGSRQRPAKPLA